MGMTLSLEVVKDFGVVAGEPIQVSTGDRLRVKVIFDYQGEEKSYTLYIALGERGTFGFDEVVSGERVITCPSSTAFTRVEEYVDVRITEDIETGIYDMYCKIKENPDVKDEVSNMIDVSRKEAMGWKGVALVLGLGLAGATVLAALLSGRKKK